MENAGKTTFRACFCLKMIEKIKYPSHAKRCPDYRKHKEELQTQAIKLKSEGKLRKEIAKILTASLSAHLRDSGIIVSVSLVKHLLLKAKQPKKTEAKLMTLTGWAERVIKDPTAAVGKLTEVGLLDGFVKSLIGGLTDQVILLTKQNQALEEEKGRLETEKLTLCQANKALSTTVAGHKTQIRTLEGQVNAMRLQLCGGVLVTNSEGSLTGKGS